MKTFVSPDEEFLIKIPDDWRFVRHFWNGKEIQQPYGFELYDGPEIAFQISLKKSEIFNKIKVKPQPSGRNNLEFAYNSYKDKDSLYYSWCTKCSTKVMLITLIIPDNIRKTAKEHILKKAKKSVKTVFILNDKSRARLLPGIRWDNFIISFAASIDLTNRAMDSGSHIELVILLANQIDSLLRQALILSKQINEKSDEIDVSLIYQKEQDKPIFEKEIYRRSLSANIINEDVYKGLNVLYNERNKVVHRYIISDISTLHVGELVMKYFRIKEQVRDVVKSLEEMQCHDGIGMFKKSNIFQSDMTREEFDSILSRMKDKHGSRGISDHISFNMEKMP